MDAVGVGIIVACALFAFTTAALVEGIGCLLDTKQQAKIKRMYPAPKPKTNVLALVEVMYGHYVVLGKGDIATLLAHYQARPEAILLITTEQEAIKASGKPVKDLCDHTTGEVLFEGYSLPGMAAWLFFSSPRNWTCFTEGWAPTYPPTQRQNK